MGTQESRGAFWVWICRVQAVTALISMLGPGVISIAGAVVAGAVGAPWKVIVPLLVLASAFLIPFGFWLVRSWPGRRLRYVDKTIRLVDVTDGRGRIKGVTFERCRIFGPGVIASQAGGMESRFDKCKYHCGGLHSLHWELAPTQKQVEGAIGVSQCHFLECEFYGIGFAGTKTTIEGWRKGMLTGAIEQAGFSTTELAK